MVRTSGRDHTWALVLLAQTSLAVATGLFALGRKSLWLDESYTLDVATRSWGGLVDVMTQRESNMASYNVLLHVWAPLGESEASLRLLSVLFFVATVPLLATLVDRAFGRRAAVVAGFLLAVNPFAVLYAQELRAYSMVMCGVTASTLLLVEWVRRPRPWVAVAYVVVSVLSFGAHYFAFFVFAAQLVSLAFVPDRRAVLRRSVIPFAATVVLALPLVWFVLDHRDTGQIDWIPPLSWTEVLTTGRWFAGDENVGAWRVLVFVVLIVIAGVGLVARWQPGRTEEQWRRALVWCWLLVPVTLTVVATLERDLWVPRYLIVVLPAFVALAAVGAVQLGRVPLQAAAVVAVVAVSLIGLAGYYPGTARFTEDWRAAAHHLASPGVRDHPVVFDPPYLRLGSLYYPRAHDLPPVDNIGVDGSGEATRTAPPDVILSRLRSAPDGVVYVVGRRGRADAATAQLLERAGYRPVSTEYFGTVFVREERRTPRAAGQR